MKIIKRIFLALAVLVAILLAAVFYYLDYQSPKYEGEIEFSQLSDSVEVIFDQHGIPHIYAQNQADAYFALGYAQAQERLFQMVLYRRLVQGRAAEIFGADLLPTDIYFKTLGLYELAEKAAVQNFNLNNPKPWHTPSLSYLEGINAFIEDGVLPVEFQLLGFDPEPFVPADIYASLNLTALGFSFAQKEDLIQNYIFENLGEEYLDVFSKDVYRAPKSTELPVEQVMSQKLEEAMDLMGLPIWEGSNGWVLAPQKTKSGKAILANDTHIGFSQPAVWYEAYLSYPGYEFYGSFLPAVPFGVLGHNRSLAWGLTIFPFDNMDYYELVDIGQDANYIYFEDTVNFDFKDIEIKIKDEESHKMTLKSTKFGPVINHIEPIIDSLFTADVALCWSVFHLDYTSVEALYQLNHAQNFTQFEQALPLIDIVGLNVMYADAEDNIAWWGCGKIPERDSLSESFKFLNSANGVDMQMGFMSFDKNPHLVNPESGFIATANNNPVLSGGVFVPGNYLPADRINLITEALEAKEKWDTEDCKDLQLNHQSKVKRDLAHFIMTQMINLPSNGNYKKAADALIKWDGNYGLKEVAPTIFERMYFHLAQQAYADELGFELFEKGLSTYMFKKSLPQLIEKEGAPWWQKYQSNEETNRAKILTLSFMMAVDELTTELGSNVNKWKWEKVNQLTHEHPMGSVKPLDKSLNVGPFPVAGGNQVLNKMESNLSNEALHFVNSGPAVRMVFDFADVGAAVNITPTGQSGNFRSPFYKDQAQLYVNGEYRGMIIDREKLGNESQQLVLKP